MTDHKPIIIENTLPTVLDIETKIAADVLEKQITAAQPNNKIKKELADARAVFEGQPMAMEKNKYNALLESLRKPDESWAFFDYDEKKQSKVEIYQGVGFVNITNAIVPKSSWIASFFGWTSCSYIQSQIKLLLDNPDAKVIALDIDSGGGSCSQISETADVIFKARQTKPIYAFSNTHCCSAAYWLASQANEIIATPSAVVGSIGVFSQHTSWAEYLKQKGVDVTYIAAGENKVNGNPNEPLSDKARAEIQALVDNQYKMFTSHVARGRGITVDLVNGTYGQGSVFAASDALQRGLVDKIDTITSALFHTAPGANNERQTTSETPAPTTTAETPAPETKDKNHAHRNTVEAELKLAAVLAKIND